MPISPMAIALIQQTGEALQKTNHQVAQEMSALSTQLVATITSAPFGGEADRAMTDLRNVSMLHHELMSMEEKLKTLYLSARSLVGESPNVQVIHAVTHQRTPASQSASEKAAQDVHSRPVKGRGKAGPTPRSMHDNAAKSLSPSARKILDAMEPLISKDGMTRVMLSDLAKLAGVSLGSVNLAIKTLTGGGFIKSNGKGSFQLL